LFAGALALLSPTGGAVLIVSRTKVSPEAIRSSVARSEAEVEKAWKLPAASAFKREVTWQSNPSMCGPASVANALRSLGETASSESAVLAGTGRCWAGCIKGLSLDELAEVTRSKTNRTVTVLRDLPPEQFQHAVTADRLRLMRAENKSGGLSPTVCFFGWIAGSSPAMTVRVD
jgi:hypothetical protein